MKQTTWDVLREACDVEPAASPIAQYLTRNMHHAPRITEGYGQSIHP
jgi:hypothetical protein